MKTISVKAVDLNYDHYSTDKYDRDIVNAIPFHKELHETIINFVRKNYSSKNEYSILDLGVGTGITSKLIQAELPKAKFDLVDFSKKMLSGARKKLGAKNVKYIFGDYSKIKFKKKYDIVISVIGIHHQNTQGKKRLLKKIFYLMNNGGFFIFGDLVTYSDRHKAALNNAKHFKHLVDNATDEKTLSEWAYHHIFLNDLSPIEDQIKWLKEIGFKVEVKFLKFNTMLIICKKL